MGDGNELSYQGLGSGTRTLSSLMQCHGYYGIMQSGQSYPSIADNKLAYLWNNQGSIDLTTNSRELSSGVESSHGLTTSNLHNQLVDGRSVNHRLGGTAASSFNSDDQFGFTQFDRSSSNSASGAPWILLKRGTQRGQNVQTIGYDIEITPNKNPVGAEKSSQTSQVHGQVSAENLHADNTSNCSDDMMMASLVEQMLEYAGFEDHNGVADIMRVVQAHELTETIDPYLEQSLKWCAPSPICP